MDGRAAAVRLGVRLRSVQALRSVTGVVILPIIYGGPSRSGFERSGREEHCHVGHKSAVADAPDTNVIHVDIAQGLQVVDAAEDVIEVGTAHVEIDSGAPIAAITGAAAVVHVEH